jgi:hypothetical protein
MGNRHSSSNISVYEIIKKLKKCDLIKIKTEVDSSDSDSGSDSPINSRCETMVRGHSLCLNLDCKDFDIIQDIKVSDSTSSIDHIDLMIGHRRFNAVREVNGTDLVITICIPKFILLDSSTLRLDVYPKTQTNPENITYQYNGYNLDDVKKMEYSNTRIEDKNRHILYVDGLVC